ncbi:MAG: hypothetical protein IID40_01615 [Planctomycetes bacterium]|nr:hypothetical protein [Planctomycetota bacterium]
MIAGVAPLLGEYISVAVGQPTTTCAVIAGHELGLADSTLVDHLEERLSRTQALLLLNRSEIDKILAEHKLSLAVGDSTRASRKNWGQVLRVDLLVLLEARPVEDGTIIELDLVETRHGLRLARDAFVWNDRSGETADWIARRVTQTARRVGAPFTRLFAVPPFESEDLLYDYAHLKTSYARAVERVLSTVPEVVVVELNHAHEIAGELALSGGNNRVERA